MFLAHRSKGFTAAHYYSNYNKTYCIDTDVSHLFLVFLFSLCVFWGIYCDWCVGGCYQNTNNKRYNSGGLGSAAVGNRCCFESENVGRKEMV